MHLFNAHVQISFFIKEKLKATTHLITFILLITQHKIVVEFVVAPPVVVVKQSCRHCSVEILPLLSDYFQLLNECFLVPRRCYAFEFPLPCDGVDRENVLPNRYFFYVSQNTPRI